MARTTFSGPVYVGDKDAAATCGISAISTENVTITIINKAGTEVIIDIDAMLTRITALENP